MRLTLSCLLLSALVIGCTGDSNTVTPPATQAELPPADKAAGSEATPPPLAAPN
jgi:hypothetical protein